MKFEKYFDHTILKPEATKNEVSKICKEAIQFGFASVCVNECFTSYVSEILKGSGVDTCVVVGFPLGASSTAVKVFETRSAVEAGADEIDMVINIGKLKDKEYEFVQNDIRQIKLACQDRILKVIIEVCLLSNEEIVKACQLSLAAGADFVKTSTGFSKAGATAEAVALMKRTVDSKAKVKAAGGIRDLKTAKAMIEAGADRLGTSATIKIISEYHKPD